MFLPPSCDPVPDCLRHRTVRSGYLGYRPGLLDDLENDLFLKFRTIFRCRHDLILPHDHFTHCPKNTKHSKTGTGKTAIALDNARFHHARALTGLHQPGQLLERITPIHPPPYAPDHNPAEHVRNTAKNDIANIQRETPEETLGTFASYVTGRAVDHDFEHLPPRETENDPVS